MLVNAAAGSVERARVAAARRRLARDAAVEVAETTSPADVDDVLARLDGDRLVVCGGDGSLHLVVDRLRAAGRLDEVTVGLIPMGTGNDLATTLGIPEDPSEAAALTLRARPRRLDLVVADDGTVCVNALHAGIGVDAAARAATLKDRLGQAAYPLGAAAAGAAASGWNLEVSVDGEHVVPTGEGDVLLVAVMNGRSFGGGSVMAPDALPDDGVADVVVVATTGPAQRAAFAVALGAGRHLERDDVALVRGAKVEIRGEPVSYNVDGELDDTRHTRRTFKVERGAWRMLARAP